MNDMVAVTVEQPTLLQTATKISLVLTVSAQDSVNLAESLESLFAQTAPPDQLVLVINGPIGIEQENLIARYRDDRRIQTIEMLRLSTAGLTSAINAGFAVCSGDWIGHTTCNDISRSDRLAIQLDYLAKFSEIDVLSSWCEEDDDGRRCIKASTIYHEALVSSLRWRNVLVPASVLIRSRVLKKVGGYSGKFGEGLAEYDLYVRLVTAGAQFRVIPAALVSVKVRRFGGLRYGWDEVRFRAFCWRSGFVTLRYFLIITLAHMIFRLSGGTLRSRLYRLLRTQPIPTMVEKTS